MNILIMFSAYTPIVRALKPLLDPFLDAMQGAIQQILIKMANMTGLTPRTIGIIILVSFIWIILRASIAKNNSNNENE